MRSGTIYTYFPSKAALLAALQEEAVRTLLGSYRTARETWDAALEDEELDERAGGRWCTCRPSARSSVRPSVVFGDEFELQRLLLTERPPGVVTGRSCARRCP